MQMRAGRQDLPRHATGERATTVAMRNRQRRALSSRPAGDFEDGGAEGGLRGERNRRRRIRAAQSDRALERREEHLAVVAPTQMLPDLPAGLVRQFSIEVEREPPKDFEALRLAVARMPMRVRRTHRVSTRWPRHEFPFVRAAAVQTGAP